MRPTNMIVNNLKKILVGQKKQKQILMQVCLGMFYMKVMCDAVLHKFSTVFMDHSVQFNSLSYSRHLKVTL